MRMNLSVNATLRMTAVTLLFALLQTCFASNFLSFMCVISFLKAQPLGCGSGFVTSKEQCSLNFTVVMLAATLS